MPRSFEHSVPSAHSVSAIHAALCSGEYWQDRVADIGGPNAVLTSLATSSDSADNQTVVVELTQAISSDLLPAAVTAIRPGDLVIARKEAWGSVDAQGASGTFEAKVEGTPASLAGTLSLRATTSGSVLTASGSAEVKVPLIGKKIEAAIIEQVIALIDAEQEFTGEWVRNHS